MLRIGRGPRAMTTSLLDDLDQLLVHGRSPDLSQVVRILVPSRALKRQLSRKIIGHFKGTVLGLEIQTPLGLGNSILAKANSPFESDPGVSAILVKRQAAKHPELRRLLNNFQDGFALCASACSDLLSAGLDSEAASFALEQIATLDSAELKQRGEEIIALTLSAAEHLGEDKLSRTSDRFVLARQELETNENFAESTAHLFVFGFSDAPGRTQEFLRTLLEKTKSTYYLDLPPEATDPQAESTGCSYARSFALGLGFDSDAIDSITPSRSSLARWQGISAVGTRAEVREIAGLIGQQLADGISPLDLGVVVRDIEAYLPEIRRQFDERGIPLATESLPRGFHPDASRLGAMSDMISLGKRLPLDRFCELLQPPISSLFTTNQVQKLDLYLRDQNLQTIGDFCQFPLPPETKEKETLRLSFTAGIDPNSDNLRTKKSQIETKHLKVALAVAAGLVAWHEEQLQEQTIKQWFQSTTAFLVDMCRWQKENDRHKTLEHLIDLEQKFAVTDMPVNRSEFRQVLERELDSFLTTSTSPSKNGVAILPLEKARSLTFASVYVLGVNRGAYPRLGHEDPLLNDALRNKLRTALPSLGRHADRAIEEGYLFAQLMECANHITLSWQRANRMGKTCARSPFLDRLQLDNNAFPVTDIPRELADVLKMEQEAKRPMLPQDAMVWAGLNGDREEQTKTKNDFLADTEVSQPKSIATSFTQLITEIDPNLHDQEERQRLGEVSPFFGHTTRDTLKGNIFVTTLEQTARCPWQVFLSRTLGCEAAPDPWDILPELDTLIVGNTVHDSLEFLFAESVGKADNARPSVETIESAMRRAAHKRLQEKDMRLPGFESILIQVALPFVVRALDLDWRENGGPSVIATETKGKVAAKTTDNQSYDIHYRVDREDSRDGAPVLTDYKTGKPTSEGSRESTRKAHFLKAFESGKLLQGAAYALGSEGSGRYLFLRPELADEHAQVIVACDDDIRQRFDIVTKRLLDSWQLGTFPPRLEESDGKPNKSCDYCEVRSACLQNDSGAKRRLSQIAKVGNDENPTLLSDLWDLPAHVQAQLEKNS